MNARSKQQESPMINQLLEVMRRLRDPESGCPWDIEQNFHTIAPFTIEEAYEVADAIESGDFDELRDELGDLLLQVVFHARMAEEQSLFAFDDVVQAICDKMIRRHPHVFSDTKIDSVDDVKTNWERIKREEKSDAQGFLLDQVTTGLPALARAVKLQKKAASVGFDWPNFNGVFDKIREEIDELEEAWEQGDLVHAQEELGDVLFALCNFARKAKIDPESSVRQTNHKFTRRFNLIEEQLKQAGQSLEQATLDEMDAIWNAIKRVEKGTLSSVLARGEKGAADE